MGKVVIPRNIVESNEEGVTEFVPDDHVLPVFIGQCKECAHYNFCDLYRINVDRGMLIDLEGLAKTAKGLRVAIFSLGFPAKKFCCTDFVNPKDHTKQCMRYGWGMVRLVGVPHKEVAFNTHLMNFLSGKTLKGAFFGNYKPHTNLLDVVKIYTRKELELEKFITHDGPF
ncbi:alcohol dehydrogenase 3-like [Triticum dicoccoides]|uniref:alcohol dehydrogenase 3-like n=1 Tax=Triticum dicoccoides TaxID=85692 RepID=UPI00188EF285|nr:alcohol dehydrogenase 3-like [Triticum dicoccoides]